MVYHAVETYLFICLFIYLFVCLFIYSFVYYFFNLYIKSISPSLQVEGDEDGYEEEYPLEGLELNTSDFMAKVAVSDFRRSWEEVNK